MKKAFSTLCLPVGVFGCISLAVLSGTTAKAFAQETSTSDALRPGDAIRLQITIPGESGTNEDLSGDYSIDEAGMVTLPIIGSIHGTGVPGHELRRQIIQRYQALYRNQAMQVTILRRVSVLGAVRSPGLYHFDPTMRVGDVLALAGGVSPQGQQDEVQVIRNGQKIRTDLTKLSAMPSDLQSGDQIFVPEKTWISRNFPWLVGVTIGIVGIIVRGY